MTKIKIFILFLLFTILLTILSSCEVTEPTSGLEVRLNTYSRETLVNGYVYDANTLQSVSGTVTVTFIGDNVSQIVDETNDPKSTFKVKNGIFVFGIKDGTEFSAQDPFAVTVVIDGSNIERETQTIMLKKRGPQSKNFYVTDPTNIPDNADSETFHIGRADNSGLVNNDIELITSLGNSVIIKQGTKLEDENGSPVTGNLTTQVTIIPLTPGNSYNAPSSITTSLGETVLPFIKFTLNIFGQSGKRVYSFSKKVTFSMIFADDFSTSVTNGEIVGLWKHSSQTNNWIKVGDAVYSEQRLNIKTINVVMSGSISGSMTKGGNILFGNPEELCTATLSITNFPENFNSTIQYFDQNGSLMASANSREVDFDIPIDGTKIASVRLNAELSDPFNTGVELGQNINLQCGENLVSLNFPKDLINLGIQIIGVCTAADPVIVINPNLSFSFRKEGSSTWQNGNLVNGLATVYGLEMASYEISANYRERIGLALIDIIDPTTIKILENTNSENLLSAKVDTSYDPVRVILEIDFGDDCQ